MERQFYLRPDSSPVKNFHLQGYILIRAYVVKEANQRNVMDFSCLLLSSLWRKKWY